MKTNPLGKLGRTFKKLYGTTNVVHLDHYQMEELSEAEKDERKLIRRAPAILRLSLGGYVLDVKAVQSDKSWTLYSTTRRSRGEREPSFVTFDVPFERTPTLALEKLADFPVNTGVTIIFGAGGAGKTPLAKRIASHMPGGADLLLFGEPYGDYVTDYEQMLVQLLEALLSGRHVVIDSLKNPVFDTPGAATSGGMSASLWPTLSDLSAVFDRCGCALISVINPTTSSELVTEVAKEALKVSTMGLIIAGGSNNWGIFWRDMATGVRNYEKFTSTVSDFTYKGRTVEFEGGTSRTVADVSGREAEVKRTQVEVQVDNMLASAMAKLLKKNQ